MVFLSGARQVGKTTLARSIAENYKNKLYFNWDIYDHKKMFSSDPEFFQKIDRVDASTPVVILDEIHKYRGWKNYLKGIYDKHHADYIFLVTGSGRLDIYQKGGDSLAGRYLQFHLFPFTLGELSKNKRTLKEFLKLPTGDFDINAGKATGDIWNSLIQFGGFPEPFAKGQIAFYRKWASSYSTQILREDIRDFHNVEKIDKLELLYILLSRRVGAPLSLNNLAQELQTAHGSVREWLRIFEIFYLTFRISPWTRKVSRAVTKEQKLYLFNFAEIHDEAARFENMVALEMLRAIYNWNEHGLGRFALNYIRTKEGHEADFVLSESNEPFLIVEAKLSSDEIDPHMRRFQKFLNVPIVQLVNKDGILKLIKNDGLPALIVTAHRWLASLPSTIT